MPLSLRLKKRKQNTPREQLPGDISSSFYRLLDIYTPEWFKK
ncbi:hypothetical protein EI42_01533 [Thermosporothrix hazakensis]|uniref:Uncharacterized protein n=1 Tax=Thermosporothrix hazakensis TaxID=644383 RepID=A0A326URD0_THEHA|nr:hypothetical protein EI42_01533 [Thermosporothrix hazakensis]